MNMTTYEKRVLTEIYRHGPLSKKEIVRQGHMSWGTAVKAVNALLNRNYLMCSGTMKRGERKTGKNAYVYDLSVTNPLVIGIDINHDRTTIILTNLREDVLVTQYHQSPVLTDVNVVKRFLTRVIQNFLDTYVEDRRALSGIGIGMPGLFFQWLAKEQEPQQLEALITFLEEKFSLRVRFEINHRAYAMHAKWDNVVFARENFMFVTIRNGVGSAIMVNGQLFTGSEGFAGEIGHLKVAPGSSQCRCGASGCLESVINQNVLFRRYLKEVKHVPFPPTYTQDQVLQALPDLFRVARDEQNPAALQIIQDVAGYLGASLAHALMLFNIPNLIVCGYFGEAGSVLIPPLEQQIRQGVYPLTDFVVTYHQLKQVGFTRGAALLVLKDFIG